MEINRVREIQNKFREWCSWNEIPNALEGLDENGYFEDSVYEVFLGAYPDECNIYSIESLKAATKGMSFKKRAQYSESRERRREELNFYKLNKPFSGSAGHHLTKDLVLYMPEELHRSVYHNIWTGENMEVINLIAKQWLGKDNLNKIIDNFVEKQQKILEWVLKYKEQEE